MLIPQMWTTDRFPSSSSKVLLVQIIKLYTLLYSRPCKPCPVHAAPVDIPVCNRKGSSPFLSCNVFPTSLVAFAAHYLSLPTVVSPLRYTLHLS